MRAAPSQYAVFLLLSLLVSSLFAASGCTKAPDVMRMRGDSGVTDMSVTDMPVTTSCTSAAQCDDGQPCTIDGCGAGGVCTYTTIDAMCAADQVCVVGMGCVTRGGGVCTADPDCDDGNFCNGHEFCTARTCITPLPESCDDGNACTVDSCDPVRDQCVRETAAGCDAGVISGDGGTAMPFEAPRDYTGSFLFVPSASSGCGAATFSISSVRFATTATTLTVTGGSFPMTQMPVPTGPNFDVTYVQPDCGTYHLVGTFSDSDSFTGTWSAVFTGSCGICPGQTASVIGVRS